MNKGKLGINLHFYAALGFIFAIFGWTMPLCLLAGLVIVVEKDEWTSKQTLQALLLSAFSEIVRTFEGYIGLSNIYIPNTDGVDFIEFINKSARNLGMFFDVIATLFGLACLALAIMAIGNVVKGKEANVPFVKGIVDWAYGLVVEKKVYSQPVNNTQAMNNTQTMNNAQFNGQQNMNYQQPANNDQFYAQQNANYQQPFEQNQFNAQAPMQNQTEQNNQFQNNNLQ